MGRDFEIQKIISIFSFFNSIQADVVLVMTCAIREGAEQKIWRKLKHLTGMKRRGPLKKGGVRMKIGILGKILLKDNMLYIKKSILSI
jgi:hypothetical protein